MIYEYANYFASSGSLVHILYPHRRADFFSKQGLSLFLKIKTWIGFYYRRFRNELSAAQWFDLDMAIQKDFSFFIDNRSMKKYPHNSIIFASSVETAYELNSVTMFPHENKFYLIQDFENWSLSNEAVYRSYRFPMRKVVISDWLKQEVEKAGESAFLIPNGFDFEYFKLTNPIHLRDRNEVCMLYHLDDRKRCCDSLSALRIVKSRFPGLHVTMFGTPERPADLPSWYSYHKSPNRETHNQIYNKAALFVGASKAEGFGLPPAESMICGCALCFTDIPGFPSYTIHGKSALLSPVFDVQALADNIMELMGDDDLRIRIATEGNSVVQNLTWDKSFKTLQAFVETSLSFSR